MRGKVDSAFVTRRIKKFVWDELEQVGFESRGRTAWRARPDSIDVITFWALGSYHSGVFGIEPHSFQIHCGVWLDYAIPSIVLAPGATNVPDPAHPDEAACPIRVRLPSRRRPPKLESRAGDGGWSPVWALTQDRVEVEEAVRESLRVIREQGLPWFDRFADPRDVLKELETKELETGDLESVGRADSPMRLELVEKTRSRLGK